jgi:hypothetical protein
MSMRITIRDLSLMLVVAVGGMAGAQHAPVAAQTAAAQRDAGELPQVENAKVETRPVSGSLASTLTVLIADSGPAAMWVGYVVEKAHGQKFACCGSSSDEAYRCGTCRLEQERGNGSFHSDESAGPGKIVHLESSGQLAVLLRLEARQVQSIRVASENCTLDAGGLRFVWLTGVRGEQSVGLLKSYVEKTGFAEGDGRHLGNEALTAIALEGDPAADAALQEFASPSAPEKLRKQTAFWLGAARGAQGLLLLEKMAKSDPSGEVRSQVAFGLYVSKEAAAVDDMIRMAREDESTHVRGQALFWLGQKAGQKAVNAIAGTIENDPDTEVKKKAVFALSQLPAGEGVPKLIEVAQNNPNREVRKQAMFWLGQSHDSRALDFFEKILRQ